MLLTSYGKYFICAATPLVVSYYPYNGTTLTFNLFFESSTYTYGITSSRSMFSSKDRKLVTLGSNIVGVGTEGRSFLVFHFQCKITNCSHCEFFGVC
jgi:hypothetical protein